MDRASESSGTDEEGHGSGNLTPIFDSMGRRIPETANRSAILQAQTPPPCTGLSHTLVCGHIIRARTSRRTRCTSDCREPRWGRKALPRPCPKCCREEDEEELEEALQGIDDMREDLDKQRRLFFWDPYIHPKVWEEREQYIDDCEAEIKEEMPRSLYRRYLRIGRSGLAKRIADRRRLQEEQELLDEEDEEDEEEDEEDEEDDLATETLVATARAATSMAQEALEDRMTFTRRLATMMRDEVEENLRRLHEAEQDAAESRNESHRREARALRGLCHRRLAEIDSLALAEDVESMVAQERALSESMLRVHLEQAQEHGLFDIDDPFAYDLEEAPEHGLLDIDDPFDDDLEQAPEHGLFDIDDPFDDDLEQAPEHGLFDIDDPFDDDPMVIVQEDISPGEFVNGGTVIDASPIDGPMDEEDVRRAQATSILERMLNGPEDREILLGHVIDAGHPVAEMTSRELDELEAELSAAADARQFVQRRRRR